MSPFTAYSALRLKWCSKLAFLLKNAWCKNLRYECHEFDYFSNFHFVLKQLLMSVERASATLKLFQYTETIEIDQHM